jgi:Domain of unknown function (DUF2017)
VKVSGRRGRLRLRLEPAEADALAQLFDQLEIVAGADADPDDAVRRRLFPAAYPDDERAQAEYRDLTEESLRTERHERIEACRGELAGGGDIDLVGDAGQRWIQVLNDLRLAIGTRLGITEDDDQRIDPAASDQDPRLLYYWLTAMQDAVVQALMG